MPAEFDSVKSLCATSRCDISRRASCARSSLRSNGNENHMHLLPMLRIQHCADGKRSPGGVGRRDFFLHYLQFFRASQQDD